MLPAGGPGAGAVLPPRAVADAACRRLRRARRRLCGHLAAVGVKSGPRGRRAALDGGDDRVCCPPRQSDRDTGPGRDATVGSVRTQCVLKA